MMTDDANIDRITKRMESLMDDIKELANIAYTYTADTFSINITLETTTKESNQSFVKDESLLFVTLTSQ